jgi:pentose-5-phosphate-3-epimerase
MIEVTPAILPQNVGELRTKVEMVKDYVDMVQLDFCDGKFVPSKTWPYTGLDTQFYDKIIKEEEGLPFWKEVNYEFDLMVENAKDKFDTFLKMGPKRIIFHVGAEQGLAEWFDELDPYYRGEIEFGVAITVNTPIDVLDPLLTHISFVQCMGIATTLAGFVEGLKAGGFDVEGHGGGSFRVPQRQAARTLSVLRDSRAPVNRNRQEISTTSLSGVPRRVENRC